MKIITSVKIVRDDEIIDVATFTRDTDGNLEVDAAEEGSLESVLDHLEVMCANVRDNM